MISHAFAQHEFGGTTAVGRKIRLEGQDYEIAGVTPAGFFGVDVGRTFDVAVPLCAEPRLRGENSSLDLPAGWFLAAIGRLKPGVTAAQATAQFAGDLSANLSRDFTSDLFDGGIEALFSVQARRLLRASYVCRIDETPERAEYAPSLNAE